MDTDNTPKTIIASVPTPTGSLRGRMFMKVLFIIFAGLLIFEVVNAAKILSKPLPLGPKTIMPIRGGAAELRSTQASYKVGDKIVVTAVLDSGGHPTGGADLIVTFDPKVLSITKTDISAGKIYQDYPNIEVDEAVGVVRISAASDPNIGFDGIGIFAKMNFTAKASGNTTLKIDYRKDGSEDSNLSDTEGKDILATTKNLDLEIK